MTTQTFLWHDYETFGAVARRDRPAQFAAIRTDAELNEIGDPNDAKMPLSAKNYVLLLVGAAVILLGMILMSGGGSDSPDEFNYAMFSWRRITLAPILVIGGFAFEIYAILKRW